MSTDTAAHPMDKKKVIPKADPVTDPDEDEVLRWVRCDEILDDKNNLRKTLTEIPELAASIKEVGLIEPPILRIDDDGHYMIVAGHRRVAAVRHLGWTTVRCMVRKAKMLPAEVVATMLIENGQRTDLDPIEEAHGLVRLKKLWECNELELGSRIGRSQPWVSGRVALLALSPEDQERVRRGEMTLGVATEKARIGSGRVRPGAKGKKSHSHFSFHHPLANKVQNACSAKRHKKNSNWIGGIGCANCWEEVIRANEREHIHTYSVQTGTCVICKSAMEAPDLTEEEVSAEMISRKDIIDMDDDPIDIVKTSGPCQHCKTTMHDCAFKGSSPCCDKCEHKRVS